MQSAVTSGTSTSSATQSAVTSGETAIATIPCTDNGVLRNYTWTQNQFKTVFTEQCTIDWPRGSELVTGSGTVKDLGQVIAYTFASCMDACVLFNADTGANNELCTAVVYNWTLTSSDADPGRNCFLKNGRGEDHYDPTVAGAYVVSNRSYVVSDSSSS
ncbi:hypothetical protein DPV78_008161 [Talaromyces pinophilus]|nr:hypothetical protein DPV78_008161 [Talaromyces pinophilus]